MYSVGYDHNNSSNYREQLARQLHQAVQECDINRVKDLLGQGANPNHQLYWTEEWRWKDPPLHKACKKSILEIVKMLVNAEADVNKAGGQNSQTPLHCACEGGHQQLVNYLIREAGCEVGELRCSTVEQVVH